MCVVCYRVRRRLGDVFFKIRINSFSVSHNIKVITIAFFKTTSSQSQFINECMASIKCVWLQSNVSIHGQTYTYDTFINLLITIKSFSIITNDKPNKTKQIYQIKQIKIT
eukprot:549030_1